jgi:small GTP-binding protein
MPERSFVSHLRTSIAAGKRALESSRDSRDQLQDLLRDYVEAVQSTELDRDEEDNEAVRSALREFEEHLSDLENSIADLQRGFATEVDQSFQSLEEASEYVTVTLFGRTKAGKSTLVETLTEGDGSTIGEGAQHKTTDVRPDHFWPSGQELLRIVDTPGVEGFEGEEMTQKANKFVEESDLIIFLVTDDKVSAGELDHFTNISTFGKPIVVLLNVKKKNNEVLVEAPEYVFEEERIEGHEKRIERYLSENFGIAETEVIPFHARGAWKSIQTSNEELRDASRIGEVKKRIKDFVEEEGLAARISAPRDVLRGYVGTIKNDIRPFAGKFRSLSWSAEDLQEKIDSALEQVDIFGKRRLSEMKGVFEEASADIPQFVDSIIRSGKSGRAINAKWESFLKEHGIQEIESGFRSEVVDQIEKEISRSADRARRAADSKFQGDDVDGVSSAFDGIQEIEGRKKARRHGRAAMRAGGGLAGGGLAAYAAANFWNPSGWAAGAAAAATAAAGYAGERAGNYAAEKWKEKTEERIKEKRDEIVGDLRNRLWSTYHSLNDELYEWLQEVQGELRSDLRKTLGRLESVSSSLWRRTVRMLNELDDYARSLEKR